MGTTLIVLAKAPEASKSRLAAAIGAHAAAGVAAALLEDTLRRGEDSGLGPRTLCWEGPSRNALRDRAAARGWWIAPQVSGDLGARMREALTDALARTPRALLLGTDCPDLGARLLVRAAHWLDDADVVLGPARDGGYVLIGASRRALPHLGALFAGMRWSGADVAAVTRSRIADCGLVIRETEPLQDLDDAADLAALAARHPFLADYGEKINRT